MPRSSPKKKKGTVRKPTIFGAGLIALDLVIGPDPSGPIRAWAGGTCGNVLTILSFLGWRSYPVARMNSDAASLRVKADLRRWGVLLEHAECRPQTNTPIIVQEITRSKQGEPAHRFRWACPQCGNWLPSYRAVTIEGAEKARDSLNHADVFFMDRLSPAALDLAKKAAASGAVVFFEPSSKSDPRLLKSALDVAHVVKYSDERVSFASSRRPGAVLLEIKTNGARGLHYRSWFSKSKSSGWVRLPSVKAPILADTCGAGDWCTAGIISTLAVDGYKGLQNADAPKLERSLRYGQVLAAWSCGFEGARGGMYSVDRRKFEKQIMQIADGAAVKVEPVRRNVELEQLVPCPACPA